MNCSEYQKLSHVEKIELIGKLIHAIQSDNTSFWAGKDLIRIAQARGVLNGVTILPNSNENTEV